MLHQLRRHLQYRSMSDHIFPSERCFFVNVEHALQDFWHFFWLDWFDFKYYSGSITIDYFFPFILIWLSYFKLFLKKKWNVDIKRNAAILDAKDFLFLNSINQILPWYSHKVYIRQYSGPVLCSRHALYSLKYIHTVLTGDFQTVDMFGIPVHED